ncbi:MAG: tetratricopeptide repeat protein [Bacteroidia bacterium]
MKKFLFSIFFIFSYCFSFTQNIDSLQKELNKAKEDTSKVNALLVLCKQDGIITDSIRSIYAESALKLSQKLNYKKGTINAFISLGTTSNDLGKFGEALKYLNEALMIYSENPGNKFILASIYNQTGSVYYYKGDYTIALSYYLKSLTLYEECKKIRQAAYVEYNVSLIYFQNKEYDKAIEYTNKTTDLLKQLKDTVSISSAISQLGNIYYEQHKYDLALKYYKESLEFTKRLKDKSYTLTNLSGIGNALFEIKKYPEALDYRKMALEIAKEINDQHNTGACLVNIGDSYHQMGKIKESIIFLNEAIDLSKKTGSKKITSDAYFSLFEVYKKENDFKEALKYHELYTNLNDTLFNEENAQQINDLSAKYENEKKEKEIAVLKAKAEIEQTVIEAKNKRKQLIYGSIILIIITISFFLVNRQRLRSKTDKIIFEKQEALLHAEKQKTEDELLHAKILLDNYTENLIEKNKTVEELQLEIEKLKGLKAVELYKEKIDNLDDLNNATILTNEDWDKFKELFEQVYKGFFIRLKDKLPDLTNAEIRLMSLVKLKLDNKQMSGILGVSPDTITRTKYRLRKKINLNENQDIDRLVESI